MLEILVHLLLLYKAEKPSVCLSVRIFLAVWISAMAARNDVGLARNDSYVFWRDEVYFKKFLSALVFRQESAKDTRVDPGSHSSQ